MRTLTCCSKEDVPYSLANAVDPDNTSFFTAYKEGDGTRGLIVGLVQQEVVKLMKVCISDHTPITADY